MNVIRTQGTLKYIFASSTMTLEFVHLLRLLFKDLGTSWPKFKQLPCNTSTKRAPEWHRQGYSHLNLPYTHQMYNRFNLPSFSTSRPFNVTLLRRTSCRSDVGLRTSAAFYIAATDISTVAKTYNYLCENFLFDGKFSQIRMKVWTTMKLLDKHFAVYEYTWTVSQRPSRVTLGALTLRRRLRTSSVQLMDTPLKLNTLDWIPWWND